MTEELHTDRTPHITTEACAWIAQLESGGLTSEDLAAFKEWMVRSPAHEKEIRRLAYLSSDLNVLTEMALPLRDAAVRQKRVTNGGFGNRWTGWRQFVTPALVAVIIFSGAFLIMGKDSLPTDPALITAAVGGHQEVNLSDGTVLKLNTDSEIEIDFSRERRKVRLLRGEAFFQVAHDSDRPFIVYAGDKSVRAVGTAFVVRHLPKKFEVTVLEGKIELGHTPAINPDVATGVAMNQPATGTPAQLPSSPSKRPIQLKAGESITYTDSIQTDVIVVVPEREIMRRLSWRNGLLDFSETPLAEVIEDMSRYTALQIEISDPELRDLKFGGIFRTDELQALFGALETTYDIKVEYVTEELVRLSRGESDGT
jgi:transmembrane sensor